MVVKVVVDGSCSEHMPVNAGVPQYCVLSPPLFLLHINDMLEDSSLHCYAQWMLFTPATQVFLGKRSTSAKINLYLQLRHPSGLFPNGVKGT